MDSFATRTNRRSSDIKAAVTSPCIQFIKIRSNMRQRRSCQRSTRIWGLSWLGQISHTQRVPGLVWFYRNGNHNPPATGYCSSLRINRQVGHSEAWLCSIFTNLSEDLALALRDAWLAVMIEQRACMLIAEASVDNRMRQAIEEALGRKEQDAVRKANTRIL